MESKATTSTTTSISRQKEMTIKSSYQRLFVILLKGIINGEGGSLCDVIYEWLHNALKTPHQSPNEKM